MAVKDSVYLAAIKLALRLQVTAVSIRNVLNQEEKNQIFKIKNKPKHRKRHIVPRLKFAKFNVFKPIFLQK